MESERNEEAGTAENKKEVADLHIVIPAENIQIILKMHKLNQHAVGMDVLLHMVREVIVERVKERFNVDLS